MHRSLLAIAMLGLVALAGCADESSQSSDDDEFSDELDDELQATDDTGVIRGVVVDASIVPIVDARVTLVNEDLEAKSNEDGAFGFSGLEPGSYFLEVSKRGFNVTQTSTTVEAGVDKPPIVKVQLQRDVSDLPFVETFRFDGFLECSVSAGIGGNVCSGEGPDGEPIDEPYTFHTLAEQPDVLQSELVWQNTQPLGGELLLLYSWDDPACDPFLCDVGEGGTSPVVLRIGADRIDEIGFGSEHDLMIRVFNQGLEETQGLVGFTFEQKFTVFTTAFYGFEPSEDYLFIEDGEPETPQA